MVGCSIRKCQSRSVKGGTIHFFSFPAKESVANEWLRYCGPKTTTKHGRVCSKHFLPSDYIKSLSLMLLEGAPHNVRKLKADAIPTLHIYNKDIPEALHTLEISNIEPDPLQIDDRVTKNNPIVTIEVQVPCKTVCSSSNIKCFPNIPVVAIDIPSKTVCSSSEVKSFPNIPIVAIDTPSKTACSSSAIKSFPVECNTPANETESSSDTVENSDDVNHEMISVPLAEHKQLQKTATRFNILKQNLEKIFTSNQIRCLMNPDKRRVRWSDEDIAAAISLRNISPKAYRYLRVNVGIPLPAFSTLRNWVSKFRGQMDVMMDEDDEDDDDFSCVV